jgi:predicted ribonuclease YlaK
MPRARKTNTPDIAGMNNKQMKRRKPISSDYLLNIEPLTDNQRIMFEEYGRGQNIFAYGAAGTGKTFLALYLALRDVLNEHTPYEKVYVVRSLVKASLYQIPYKNMVKYMFHMLDNPAFDMLYENLKAQETISFWSTSFLRGTTLDKAIVIVDECQNLNFHELDSIITRVGEDTKILFCGDASQSDLQRTHERSGIIDFQRILQQMKEFSEIEYGVEDIVRSGLIKSYLIAKINLGL